MSDTATRISHFNLHGTQVCFSTNNAFVHSAADTLLEDFSVDQPATAPDIHVSILDRVAFTEMVNLPSSARLVYAPSDIDHHSARSSLCPGPHIHLDEAAQRYYFVFEGRGYIACDLPKGLACGYFLNPQAMPQRLFEAQILYLALSHLLKARGLYPIHGAALTLGEKGVLIPGASGDGKSTTAIALAKHGFGFLGDDLCFLARRNGGPQLLSFSGYVDITEQTASFFKELASWPHFRRDLNLRKKSFRMADVFAVAQKTSCTPHAVLFPSISATQSTRLAPMARGEALARILPHSLLVLDKPTARTHFEMIDELIRQTRCYTLYAGSDFAEMAEKVAAAL